MIQSIDLRGRDLSRTELLDAVPRAELDVTAAAGVAAALIGEVRDRGAEALAEQAERFDGVRPPRVRVPAAEIAAALESLAAPVRGALEEAIDRVRRATEAGVPPERITQIVPGGRIIQRWQPVERAGLYVPGGKAVYPSSVVMNVVPAQIAGVGSIALASPPQREFGGGVHPTILAAAALLGIDDVYAMGGAGAIGALAYGVPEVGLDPVDVITGPGNVYVAAAKRVVSATTGIDSEAGATEILVIADAQAEPRLVAADLLSQAEHDEQAAAVLVTDSPDFADRVSLALTALANRAHHRERVAAALGGPQSAIVLVDDIPAAARFSNAYGPEHLELHTVDPHATLRLITSAGAVFLGAHTPVSLGDYLAGSNHVLPTGGQARFSAGLGAYAFLRPQQIVEYDRDALAAAHDQVVALAQSEDLPAHGDAVTARFE